MMLYSSENKYLLSDQTFYIGRIAYDILIRLVIILALASETTNEPKDGCPCRNVLSIVLIILKIKMLASGNTYLLDSDDRLGWPLVASTIESIAMHVCLF